MAHESFDRSEVIKGSSNRALGLVFAGFFLIVAVWPWLFGGQARLWSLAVSAVFAVLAHPGGRVPVLHGHRD